MPSFLPVSSLPFSSIFYLQSLVKRDGNCNVKHLREMFAKKSLRLSIALSHIDQPMYVSSVIAFSIL